MNPEHEERIRDFLRNMTGHPDRGDIALLLAEIDVLREALKESVVLQLDSIQAMDQLEKELDEQKGMVRDFWASEKKNRETMRRLENLEKAVGVAFSLDVESSPTQSRYNKLGVRADHIEMGDNKPRSDQSVRLTPEREAQIRDHLKREKLIEGPLEGNPHVIELLAELDALREEVTNFHEQGRLASAVFAKMIEDGEIGGDFVKNDDSK